MIEDARKYSEYSNYYSIFISLDDENGVQMVGVLNRLAPNNTVCPECSVDDFQHIEGCKMNWSIITDPRIKDYVI